MFLSRVPSGARGARRLASMTLALVVCLCTAAGPARAEIETEGVGIEEHLGETIPLDIAFVDEQGRRVTLGEAIQGPTVLSLVYYSCPGICTPLLNGMVQVFNRTPLEPGESYRVITVSFDPSDTPQLATQKKANYLRQITRPFPPEHWMWLTGDQESIQRLTQAVGFKYRREGKEFVHPATLVVLSPSGRVARYLLGLSYQPFDLQMALTEASEERSGPTIRKALLLCFSYDPESRTYVANVTRIGGAATLLMALIFIGVVLLRSRREVPESSQVRGDAHGN